MRIAKIFTVMCILLICSAYGFSSTWEGKAGRGDVSLFPSSGNFAKSNSFPMNELVDVTNPLTGTSVTVVITGKLDVAGFLLMLSPDAADALGMSGHVSQVSAEKKNRYFEPSLTASVSVSATVSDDPDVNPQAALAPIKKTPSDVITESVPVEPIAVPAEPVVPAETKEITSEPIAENNNTDIVPLELPAVVAHIAETTIISSEKKALEEQISVPEPAIDEIAAVVIVPAEEVQKEPDTMAQSAPVADSTVADAITVIPLDTFYTGVNPISDEFAFDAMEFAVAPPVSESIPIAEFPDMSTADIVQAPVPSEPVINEDKDEFDYALFSAEALPPPYTVPSVPENPPSEVISTPAAAVIPATKLIPAQVSEAAAELTHTEMVSDPQLAKWMHNRLEQNKFYVQLAAYSDVKNVLNLTHAYESKYPIVISPGTNTYQVLIGPLSKDEYGAVLERFKRNGFTDAFVRKGE